MTTYLTDSDGKFIPATQRPDGTWRKARRVKEGYVPQEEVPLYESKGKQFAQRKTNLPVGMCPLVAAASKKEREKQERSKAKKLAASAASNTNSKLPQKPAQGMLSLSSNHGLENAFDSLTVLTNKPANVKPANCKNATTSNHSNNNDGTSNNETKSIFGVDELSKNLDEIKLQCNGPEEDPAKKLKKLKKKIREIESIQAKIKSGELKNPGKDQIEKIKRKKQILEEIQLLEDTSLQ